MSAIVGAEPSHTHPDILESESTVFCIALLRQGVTEIRVYVSHKMPRCTEVLEEEKDHG
jgi:hypothetical protein